MNRAFIIWAIISLSILIACKDKFPVIEDLNNPKYFLIDQNEKKFVFPEYLKGKIGIVGYIFTNCPDICPLTTNNMRLIQERLKKEKIRNVQFVSISFDPENDKPEALKKFAEIRNLDLSNWTFLTGEKATINKLMKHAGIVAVSGDSTVFPSGKVTYYYIHTDRIQLIDEDGKIRKNYPGSTINIEEIIADVKQIIR